MTIFQTAGEELGHLAAELADFWPDAPHPDRNAAADSVFRAIDDITTRVTAALRAQAPERVLEWVSGIQRDPEDGLHGVPEDVLRSTAPADLRAEYARRLVQHRLETLATLSRDLG
jgi:hypothetical protein